jgi:putative spermidine/putrescine transport system ATP-binding protein
VASFIGSLNVLKATVLDPGPGSLSVDGQSILTLSPVRQPRGAEVKVSIRPESLQLAEGRDGKNRLEVTVVSLIFLGSIVRLAVRTSAQELFLDTFNRPDLVLPAVGTRAAVSFAPGACFLMEA